MKGLNLQAISPEHRHLFTVGLRNYLLLHVVAATEELESMTVGEARKASEVKREMQNIDCWPDNTEGRITTFIFPMGKRPMCGDKEIPYALRNIIVSKHRATSLGWLQSGIMQTIDPELDIAESS